MNANSVPPFETKKPLPPIILAGAEKPCPDYNQWKKYRIRQLWNDLPFDIKQYEYEYYKEFLTYKDVLMLT